MKMMNKKKNDIVFSLDKLKHYLKETRAQHFRTYISRNLVNVSFKEQALVLLVYDSTQVCGWGK